MDKASTPKQDPDRRSRIAAQRAAAQRTRLRNRLLIAGGAIVVVVVVVVVFVVIGGNGSSGGGKVPTPPTGSALAQTISQLTSVPVTTSDTVGAGNATSPPTTISGTPLTSGGKPEMLYVGAEYCPYCAAERWSIIVALSRFGTFTGLQTTHSAAADGAGTAEPYPNTATWTFAHSTFTSDYLTFSPVEIETNVPDKATGAYTTLQTPTKAQQALVNKYDAAYQDAIPFIDIGNKYLSVGASYDPSVLSGLTWSQIATDLHNPDSPVAKSVLGGANYLTAAICGLTNDQPASACTATVKGMRTKI
ncbi:MAG TPA: DUF929 family protein [Trebonia sp.]|jgi:hypothetical protein|nr:DUF929 family protein [Trebonia sp.]